MAGNVIARYTFVAYAPLAPNCHIHAFLAPGFPLSNRWPFLG